MLARAVVGQPGGRRTEGRAVVGVGRRAAQRLLVQPGEGQQVCGLDLVLVAADVRGAGDRKALVAQHDARRIQRVEHRERLERFGRRPHVGVVVGGPEGREHLPVGVGHDQMPAVDGLQDPVPLDGDEDGRAQSASPSLRRLGSAALKMALRSAAPSR